ncbi:trypsin-like peptidase domain-containing protein [Ruegeria arenilitoris]|uniref:trypsin-like peptidase domain-containing protein n=1 Tax=Ruegeria arenilitoris TaxID=1173585 RepID=UPI00147C13D5|nr:trypsin-like peptidase domain-containing protein [Ruegeria arenilitoris]
MRTPDKSDVETETGDVRAFLESLTGPSRGTVTWLVGNALAASVGPDRILKFRRKEDLPPHDEDVATIQWSQGGYALNALPGRDIWVNGQKTASAVLGHGDMIEFGAEGPMSRYRVCDHSFPAHHTVEDIISDAYVYARSSRRPFARKMSGALREGGRRLTSQTTVLFRVTVIGVLLLIFAFGYLLFQNDRKLADSLKQESLKIEAVAVMLTQTREDALTADDLVALREAFDNQVISTEQRLGTLEERAGASRRVITASTRSIAFIQGAYGLRQTESGKLLRHVLGPDGEKLKTPFGKPWIEPDAEGAPAEFQFTGTGFLLQDTSLLVTNRHVALPWTTGDRAQALKAAGLEAEILSLLAYLPEQSKPMEAVLLRASKTADLALLSVDANRVQGLGLSLAPHPTRAGEEVFLLGFPTGLKALIVQAGPDFLKTLERDGAVDFWTIAKHLSEQNKIRPLASRGIVAQTSPGAVVYDAETTTGGSGGPALNRNGEVVAINAAILPEFGGSNIGVPVSHLKILLDESD